MIKGITQHVFPFALALLLLLQPVVPYIEYLLFQDYIARELCERRNDTSSHCQGSCWLNKELVKQQHAAPESETAPQFSSKYRALEYDLHTILSCHTRMQINPSFPTTPCRLYAYNFSFAAFHPPKFFV